MTVNREMVRRKQNTHICEPMERSYNITNWSAAWNGLDFSPAVQEQKKLQDKKLRLLVLGESKEVKSPDRCKDSFILFNKLELTTGCLVGSVILCRTEEGYWVNISVTVKANNLIQEYLKKDPMLNDL